MTIAIDCRMIKLSGIGRYLKELLPYICEVFSNVVLLGVSEDLSIYAIKYSSVSIVEMSAPIYSLKEQFLLYSKVPVCDVFWSPHFNIPMLPVKANYKIVTIHDAYHLAFYKQLSIPQKLYAKLFLNGAVKKSDKVITVSNFSKGEILKYTSTKYESKVFAIHNGVGNNLAIEQNDSTKPINGAKDDYILFVGNVKPHKNLKRTMLAFKKLISEKDNTYNDNLTLKIVGKKDGFISGDSEIEVMFKDDKALNDRIAFTGFVSDAELEILYKNALCLIFPSYYEGFGFPPLEAMVFGCATVTSNAASMPEICEEATIYFNPYDIDDIAKKLGEICSSNDLRNNLIEKGFNQAKKFKWEVSAKKHIEVFNSLINKN